MADSKKVYTEDDDQFYFESDHLALRGNNDYTSLLKTIVILVAQRTQAIADLDKLMLYRCEAVKDPISFVAKLQNGNFPELPGPQSIAENPFINWAQYNVASPDIKVRPQTRHANVSRAMTKTEQDDSKILVRGRAFDDSKPETFNQLWTSEEQKRLEQLLIEYPPEEVEMRRWTKIANALGNRTPKQVSSRVQKYFIKLLRAGLPIPGRGPKVKLDTRRSLGHRNQRNNHLLFKKSTFFPHQEFFCSVSEDFKDQQPHEESEEDTGNGSEDDNPELRQIELLRQVKAEKKNTHYIPYEHVGYKCSVCGEDPLRGTRWHCIMCQDGVDLCADCAVAQLEAESPSHNPSHRLTAIRPPNYIRSYDLDYFPQNFSNSSYNYLDPNFFPE